MHIIINHDGEFGKVMIYGKNDYIVALQIVRNYVLGCIEVIQNNSFVFYFVICHEVVNFNNIYNFLKKRSRKASKINQYNNKLDKQNSRLQILILGKSTDETSCHVLSCRTFLTEKFVDTFFLNDCQKLLVLTTYSY